MKDMPPWERVKIVSTDYGFPADGHIVLEDGRRVTLFLNSCIPWGAKRDQRMKTHHERHRPIGQWRCRRRLGRRRQRP